MSALTDRVRLAIGRRVLTPQAFNQFREAAIHSRNRSYYSVAAQDAYMTDTAWTRISMLSHARRLRANVGFVAGIVRDLQLYTLGPNGLCPKSLSTNETWADAADDYFEQWSNICDVTQRFNFRQIQRLSVALLVVDGDFGLILTETKTGFPRIQLIEAHQIASSSAGMNGSSVVDDTWIDGVQVNPLGQPLRYRVVTKDDYKDVDAAAFVHVFEPERATAQRGISHFSPVINHLRDVEDILSYVKLGVKKDNSIPMWRTTLTGTAQLNQWDAVLNASNAATDITLEQMLAGEVPTLKPGESLNTYNSGKPSNETMSLIDYLETDTLAAVGLPANWKNLQKEGGATLRAALIRAQYRFLELQALLKDKEFSRIRNWVVAKASKRGDLPPLPADWWKHLWRGPAHLTADIAKINKENREDIKFGVRTFQQDAAEAGDDWVEIREENQAAADDLLTRARALVDKHGVPMQTAIELLQQRSPNPTGMAAEADKPGSAKSEEMEAMTQ